EQLHREASDLRGAGGYFADAGEVLVRDRRAAEGRVIVGQPLRLPRQARRLPYNSHPRPRTIFPCFLLLNLPRCASTIPSGDCAAANSIPIRSSNSTPG